MLGIEDTIAKTHVIDCNVIDAIWVTNTTHLYESVSVAVTYKFAMCTVASI